MSVRSKKKCSSIGTLWVWQSPVRILWPPEPRVLFFLKDECRGEGGGGAKRTSLFKKLAAARSHWRLLPHAIRSVWVLEGGEGCVQHHHAGDQIWPEEIQPLLQNVHEGADWLGTAARYVPEGGVSTSSTCQHANNEGQASSSQYGTVDGTNFNSWRKAQAAYLHFSSSELAFYHHDFLLNWRTVMDMFAKVHSFKFLFWPKNQWRGFCNSCYLTAPEKNAKKKYRKWLQALLIELAWGLR